MRPPRRRATLDLTNAQAGDVRVRDAAGRDVIHNGAPAREIAEILWRIDARLDAQRDEDRADRERRQRETDMHQAGTRQAIDALREQVDDLRQTVARRLPPGPLLAWLIFLSAGQLAALAWIASLEIRAAIVAAIVATAALLRWS